MKFKKLLAAVTAMMMLSAVVFQANADSEIPAGYDDSIISSETEASSEESEEITPPANEETVEETDSSEGETDVTSVPENDTVVTYSDEGISTLAAGILINKTNFPDENFRNYLLGTSYGSDGVITPEEIETVTVIDVRDMGIENLMGIKNFTYLQTLYCQNNYLKGLDVTGMGNLKTLDCSNNCLAFLDITDVGLSTVNYYPQNDCTIKIEDVNIDLLIAELKKYGGFDVSKVYSWGELYADSGLYTGIPPLTRNKFIFTYLYGRGLFTVNIIVDVPGITLFDQEKFPDPKFSEALINYLKNNEPSCINTVTNELDRIKIANLKSLNVSDNDIDDLTGIEYFTGLTSLNCSNNNLKKLDLSKNTELKSLYCEKNKLTELDLSKNTKLTDCVWCQNNELTTLNAKGLTALEEIKCSDNKLTSLDLSGLASLKKLYASSCPITDVDLSDCESLIYAEFYGESEDVYNDNGERLGNKALGQLKSIKLNGCKALEALYLPFNQLSEIDLSDCENLTYVNLETNNFASLNVSGLSKLTRVDLIYNRITSLNIDDTNITAVRGIGDSNQFYNAGRVRDGDHLLEKLHDIDNNFDPTRTSNWEYSTKYRTYDGTNMSDPEDGWKSLEFDPQNDDKLTLPDNAVIIRYDYDIGKNLKLTPRVAFTIGPDPEPPVTIQPTPDDHDPTPNDPTPSKPSDPQPPAKTDDTTSAGVEDVSSAAGIYEDSEMLDAVSHTEIVIIAPVIVIFAIILKKRLKTNR